LKVNVSTYFVLLAIEASFTAPMADDHGMGSAQAGASAAMPAGAAPVRVFARQPAAPEAAGVSGAYQVPELTGWTLQLPQNLKVPIPSLDGRAIVHIDWRRLHGVLRRRARVHKERRKAASHSAPLTVTPGLADSRGLR